LTVSGNDLDLIQFRKQFNYEKMLALHSYYSLRYGTLSLENLINLAKENGYEYAVLTDINNSTGCLEYIRLCREKNFNGQIGMEFRNGDTVLYSGLATSIEGFREINELITKCNLAQSALPERPPEFSHALVIYPFGKQPQTLKDNEFVGIKCSQINKIHTLEKKVSDKCIIWQPVTFIDKAGFRLHCQLRAISNNILLSQLSASQAAAKDEILVSNRTIRDVFEGYPELIRRTDRLLSSCSIDIEFKEQKNKKLFSASRYDDCLLLEKLAFEGMKYRYGNNPIARGRIRQELEIINQLGFCSYFLITWDIVRYGMSRGFYHVGRGSGANSVVAYCLKITDVCPIELDLYFERFLNPKRKSPPDFDIDYSWDEREDVQDYIFKRYGREHTALMGAMSTFKDRSIIRELGKVYGLPKSDIDRLIDAPDDVMNKHEITNMILSVYNQLEDFPNMRTIHSSGVLISELPLSYYTALDFPPKGFPTAQFDMYTAEEIGFEKFDILSQRGIGHIKECAEIVRQNRGQKIDVHDIAAFKNDPNIKAQLKSGDTIGCFYVESPAMRGLLKKLKCEEYLTLVAASSIIRPGVAKSGMMRAYIERFHDPSKTAYLHPVMEDQLKETYGVMVYQEDVLKVGHHFGGLDLADADVLRRMMSGKGRNKKHLEEIEEKYYNNCATFGYPDEVAREVWRQIESFAGYSFSKAHSASFAVESFQSLFLKTYFPLEFMTAVINNFGGFYSTRVYMNEARKAGAVIHLPCVNRSSYKSTLDGVNLYIGFVHLKGLENSIIEAIIEERDRHGSFTGLENFIIRTGVGLEQLLILIRIGAFRFTTKDKKALMWEAHSLIQGKKRTSAATLFQAKAKTYVLPQFVTSSLENAYDEIELLGWPLSHSTFDMLKSYYRGDVTAKNLIDNLGKTVRIVGDFVTAKYVPTARGTMAFGAFTDVEGNFFDTTNFPQIFRCYPFSGNGAYLIQGKVVEEFGFPSIEVEKMAKLPIKPDPRSS
jgi:DNA polymerase-3 subunit alpha